MTKYLFNMSIQVLVKQKPKGSRLSDGTEIWSGVRSFPEPITFGKKNLRGEINSFITAIAVLYGKLMGVGIPPEDKVERKINKKLAAAEQTLTDETLSLKYNSSEDLRQFCVKNLQELRTAFRPVEGSSGPNAWRMVSQIELVHNVKDNRTEILNFLHSTSSLRCENFKMKGLSRYRIEQAIFDSSIHLDTVASIGASLAVFEVIKLLTVG